MTYYIFYSVFLLGLPQPFCPSPVLSFTHPLGLHCSHSLTPIIQSTESYGLSLLFVFPSLSSQSHLGSHFSILYILGIYQCCPIPFIPLHSILDLDQILSSIAARKLLTFLTHSTLGLVNRIVFLTVQKVSLWVVESPQSRRVGRFCHVPLMEPWGSISWCTQPDLVFHPRLEKPCFFLHLLLKHQLLSAPCLPSSSWLLVAVESDKGSGGQHKRQSRNK